MTSCFHVCWRSGREAFVSDWPSLRAADWAPTRDVLRLWAQIVGKIKLAKTPMVNHWWNVTMLVSPSGLTTGSMLDGDRTFEIEFDFIASQLRITVSDGGEHRFALGPMPVAAFYEQIMGALSELGIEAKIFAVPVELPKVIPFAQDTSPREYRPEQARTFWLQLVQANRLFSTFRSPFTGKASVVHFFWGFFDLTVSLYSGREAPLFTGQVPNCPQYILTESYSREEAAVGFSADGGDEGAFYAYAYPEPAGYPAGDLGIPGALYDAGIGRWLLPWEVVRVAEDPDALVMSFLEATFRRQADLAGWDQSLVNGPLTTPA
jgi:hypothetical protein